MAHFQKNSICQAISPRNFDFLKQFRKISIFQAISQTENQFFRAYLRKISICSGNFTKNFGFSRQIQEEFRFIKQFHKKLYFLGKFPKHFDLLGNFTKNFDFPAKNWLFTAISRQIILFLFKSHHFQTHFLYMIGPKIQAY